MNHRHAAVLILLLAFTGCFPNPAGVQREIAETRFQIELELEREKLRKTKREIAAREATVKAVLEQDRPTEVVTLPSSGPVISTKFLVGVLQGALAYLVSFSALILFLGVVTDWQKRRQA